MDPNAVLQQARQNMRAALDAEDAGADVDTIGGFLADACAGFAELDQWLSTGGFLPDDWQH